jgi:putative endonuclease
MNNSLRKGLRFEDQARRYLATQGLDLLESNYRCRFGEIDLIMRDADTLCFIEVRFRKSLDFGGASASITPAKQRRIVKAALFYLSSLGKNSWQQALRFDALLIQQQAGDKLDFNWIQNAFYAE